MGTIYARGRKLWLGYKDAKGKWVYEPSGFQVGHERQAKKLLDSLESKVAAGVELGEAELGPVTVARYVKHWIEERRKLEFADAANDEARLKKHVLPDLGRMLLSEVRTRHILALIHKLRSSRKLAPRTVRRVYGALHMVFQDALVAEHISATPCVLTKAQIGPNEDKDPEWRSGAVFTREELEALISSDLVPWDRQVVYALEGIAGLRHGEMAGLRWRNYDQQARPLGKLVVARSYNRNGTKTKRTRDVPVHPTLAAMLAAWKLKGWPEMMGRFPGADDLIVPSREQKLRSRHHSRNKLLDDLERLGLRHRRGHDLRRTMITLARVDGARADLLEMVTHGPKGDIINIYTSMPWPSLCDEVAKLNIERRLGQVIALPRAANAPEAASPSGPLTTDLTTVWSGPKPDPKKLWDLRPILKARRVEAPGIEASYSPFWRCASSAVERCLAKEFRGLRGLTLRGDLGRSA